MNKKEEGLNYLKQYPELNKWINTCICCGSKGYNPKLPKELTSRGGTGEYITASARNLRRYFQPLSVNELGICETCEKVSNFNIEK